MVMGQFGLEGLYVLFKVLFIGFIIFIMGIIIFYVFSSLVLDNLNKQMYKKRNVLVWIPFFKTYFLGKLTVGKKFGIFLVSMTLLIRNLDSILKFLKFSPTDIETITNSNLLLIYPYFIGILYIYAYFKYRKLKKSINNQTIGNELVLENTENNKIDSL